MSHIRSSVGRAADRLLSVLIPAYIVLLAWMWSTLPFNIQWADFIFMLIVFAFAASNGIGPVSFTSLDLFVLVYLGGLACSLAGAPSVLRGLSELAKAGYLVLLYFVFGAIVRDDEAMDRTASWVALTTVALCGFGLLYSTAHIVLSLPTARLGRDMSVPYLGRVLRLSLGFFTPELFGEYLTCTFPFVLGFFLFRGSRQPDLRGFIAIVGVVVVEVLTFSHSWVGFLLAGLVSCWNRWKAPAWIRARTWLVIATCALLLVSNVASVIYVHDVSIERRRVPAPTVTFPEHVPESDEWPQLRISATYNYLYYFILKTVAWESFRQHPLNGLGLGNFREATERAYSEGKMNAICRDCMPHSTLFGQLAETGLIGTSGWVALWMAVLVLGGRLLVRDSIDQHHQWVVRASLAGFIGLLVNGINVDIMHFRFLWISLAFVRGRALSAAGHRPHSSRIV